MTTSGRNALAVSGLLVGKIGGVSVKPYQPAGYWGQLNFPKRKYQSDQGADQYCRGVYTHWQRTFLHPSLRAFDAPAREECTARRTRSNTPLQSLVLLNDPSYVEAARVLAERVILETDHNRNAETDGPTTNTSSEDSQELFEARLTWLFDQTLARLPRSEERQILDAFYRKNITQFCETPEAAAELAKAGRASSLLENANAPTQQIELAGWTMVARAVLNLHETITRY
jgi:hypothetical protein